MATHSFGATCFSRDDGQRITVYPRQRRLLVGCVVQAAILAGIACVFVFLRPDDLRMWIGSALFVCVLIPVFLATLYRLVIHKPVARGWARWHS